MAKYKLIGWNPDRMDNVYAERLKVEFPVVVEPFESHMEDCTGYPDIELPTHLGTIIIWLGYFVFKQLETNEL